MANENEQKHTPGPWRANSSWIEGPKMALRVAAIDWPKRGSAPASKAEAEANARLIAAAPDLLAALEDVVFEDSDKSEVDRIKSRVKAHAAIVKASAA